MINNLFFKKNSMPMLILGFSNIPFEYILRKYLFFILEPHETKA